MKIISRVSSSIFQYFDFLETKFAHTIGYVYALIGHLSLTLLSMNIRRAADIPHYQIVYFRTLSLAVMVYITCKFTNQPCTSSSKRINLTLLILGSIGLVGGSLGYYGIQKVPLSESSVLLQTTPAFTSLLAFIFLKEKYDWFHFGTLVFCTIGVLLVAKPPFLFEGYSSSNIQDNEYREAGIIALLTNAFINGINFVILKTLAASISSNLSVFYGGLIPCLLSPLLVVTEGVKTFTLTHWYYMINVFIFGYFGQVFLVRSLKFGKPGRLATIGYSQIVFSCVLDLVVLGSVPDFYSLMGGLFILCCMILSLYRTIITERKSDIAVNNSINNSAK